MSERAAITSLATIRRAVPGDEAIVRSLRIQALSDAPDAFESTLERELGRTAAEWQRWVADSAIFLLEHPDGPKGIVGGIPHTEDPEGIFLVSMWVHASLRGTGAADALVASVLVWAKAEGARDVWLHVGKNNLRARRLYERSGFRATGNEIINEEEGAVEVEMRCAVGRGSSET